MINLSELLTGKIDSTLNGITDYISKKAESLTNGFVRSFTLSNEEKMTFINDVYIDLCFSIGDRHNVTTPTHSLDNNTIIAETIKKEPTIWNLECKFTSANHVEKYEKLLKMIENGDLITLLYSGKVVENLIIMSLNRNTTNIHYTDFSITLVKLNLVNIATIPAPDFKKVVSKPVETVTGKEETTKIISDTYGDRKSPVEFTDEDKKDFINMVNPFAFNIGWGGAKI